MKDNFPDTEPVFMRETATVARCKWCQLRKEQHENPKQFEPVAGTFMKILSDGENPTTLFSTDSLFVIEIDGVQFHSTMLDWLLIHPNPDAAHRFERKGNVVVNHTFVSSSIKDQPGWSAAT